MTLSPTELSPLNSAPLDTISLMFDADPSALTDDQFTSLIKEVRRRRSEFASAEAAKQAQGKKGEARTQRKQVTSIEAAAADKPAGELSVDDLFE